MVVLEVCLMIVTPQKELAMEVTVRIEEGMTLVAAVEDMAAVTEAMEDQIVVIHPLIGLMALPLIDPGQGAMVEGPQQIGLTLQVHILEVGLRTFQSLSKEISMEILLVVEKKEIATRYCEGCTTEELSYLEVFMEQKVLQCQLKNYIQGKMSSVQDSDVLLCEQVYPTRATRKYAFCTRTTMLNLDLGLQTC